MYSKKFLYYLLILVIILSFSYCTAKRELIKTNKTYKNISKITESYKYPTDSTTINKWIKNNNFKAIHKHSWNIWKHLTDVAAGDKLRYQTWSSPQQIVKKLNNHTTSENKPAIGSLLFKKPNQFGHAKAKQADFDDTNIVEVVAYNKAAEKYAIDNKIFFLSTLKKMYADNLKNIPEFPNEAITIKPVYKIITQDKLDNGIYTMSAWNSPKYISSGYPESAWKSCVHVDVTQNKTNPNGNIDYNCNNKNDNNTFYLSDFIHFKINSEQATSYNLEINQIKDKKTREISNAKEGDIAILIGMHVATKEIKRWTWQTFWWSATPLTPQVPSSNEIANTRNGITLNGAANHYAMSDAYSMLVPAQPYVNGTNEGEPVIAFNPYLESGFGNDVFNASSSYFTNKGNKVKTNLGVLTNCMTCHIAATVNTSNGKKAPYFGDRYLSYKDPAFKDKLMLDFSWSIQANIDSLH